MDGISQWEFALAYYGLLLTTVDYIFDKFDIDQKGIDVVTRNRLITTTNFREFITKFLTEEVQQVKYICSAGKTSFFAFIREFSGPSSKKSKQNGSNVTVGTSKIEIRCANSGSIEVYHAINLKWHMPI